MTEHGLHSQVAFIWRLLFNLTNDIEAQPLFTQWSLSQAYV